MDRKTFALKITNLDGEGRTVEGYANVFGNIDAVGDIVHPGAFAKTLNERGGKIKFCWQHDLTEPLGRIVEMHEDAYGLAFKAIISDTQRGRDALALLKDGAVDSFSIGYDSIRGATDYSKDPASGATIRNLREVKLYEVSLVSLPANELATVTALKEAPAEGKPYQAIHEGDVWKVYKLDADGNPTGKPLGEHDNESDAQAQVRALYANENGKSAKEMTPYGPVQRLGHVLQGTIHRIFTLMCDDWYTAGLLSTEERIMLSGLIGDALGILEAGIPPEIAMREPYVSSCMGMMAGGGPAEGKAGRVLSAQNAQRIMGAMESLRQALLSAGIEMPEQDDDTEDTASGGADKQAGPGGTPPPTLLDERTRQLKLIETELHQIDLWR